MKHQRLLKKLGKAANIISAILLIASVVTNFVPSRAVTAGNNGAIWTTTGTCGVDPQDANHYLVGDVVYINYSNFDPGTYHWIIGRPGNSGGDIDFGDFTVLADPNDNSKGIDSCFSAHLILPGETGEYQAKVEGVKGDNYNVDIAASVSFAIGACQWSESGATRPVTITLTGASLTITGVGTYTESTSINLAPGSYPYTWEANQKDYKGSGSGILEIPVCTPGTATVDIQTGTCTYSQENGSQTPVTITLSHAYLTINGSTYYPADSPKTISLAGPVSYPYSWGPAELGYTGSGSDTLNIGTCQPGTPHISLVKVADPLTYDAVNEVISYSYTISNDGTVDLAGNFTISDDKVTVTCPEGGLLAGTHMHCTASHTINQADLDAGSITNIATASGNDLTSNQATATVTAVQNASLTIVKTADPLFYYAAGDLIGYSYLVTNTGNVTITDLYIVDNKFVLPITNCLVTTLAPEESTTCTASYTIVDGDITAGSVVNIASANGLYGMCAAAGETVRGTGCPIQSLTDTETVQRFIMLSLAGICAADPTVNNGWTITNNNPFAITEYEIRNQINDVLGTGGPIPANSSVNIETAISDATYLTVFVSGVEQNTAAAATGCIPPVIPPPPPQVIIPVTGFQPPAVGGAEVLIPVTGVDLGAFSHSLPTNLFSLSLAFFGLGLVLNGLARKQED